MHPALKKYIEGKIELTPQQEQLVDNCFKPKTTHRHEILLSKGAVARHLYFVVKGCLRVFLTDEGGREFTRFLIFEGRFGTAFPSFISKTPSVAAVQSIEPSQLLTLSYQDRQVLFDNIPGWETMYLKELERDYIASIQRIESLIAMNAKTRYQLLLENDSELIKRLPSRIVADYLGISQETLSRLKSKK